MSSAAARRRLGDARDLDRPWYSRREPGDGSPAAQVVVLLHTLVLAHNGEVRPTSNRRMANSGAVTGTVYPRRGFGFRWPRFWGLILDFDPTVFSDLGSLSVHE